PHDPPGHLHVPFRGEPLNWENGPMNGTSLNTSSLCRRLSLVLIPLWLAAGGCAPQVPGAPPAANNEAEGCRVSGRIVSTEWRELGGGIERAIVSAWTEGKRVEEVYGQ